MLPAAAVAPHDTVDPGGTADTLLGAASNGVRWVLLSPPPGAGVTSRSAHRLGGSESGSPLRVWPAPPALTFSLVDGSSAENSRAVLYRASPRDARENLNI